WRLFPRHERKLRAQGRSANFFTPNPATDIDGQEGRGSDEGRGLMKMFKGMFPQQESNIIIIAPAPTTTAPAPTTPTSPTTSSPTGATRGTSTTYAAELGRDDDLDSDNLLGIQDDLLNDPIFSDNPQDEIRMPANSVYSRNKKYKNTRQRRRKSAQRNNAKRNQLQRQRNNMRTRNRNLVKAEQIAQSIAKMPRPNGNVFSLNNGNNNNGGGSSSSFFNINANERIQSIMNALRRQTPIVYNY
ncbi:uncharacterized protein LOC133327899, partial [Musca vetustissima]|uniref:uncharacterized protein LOC133327899 n=1 Tax=Musca vetustissima TaxID=27455 RepID=UPI002AB68C1F